LNILLVKPETVNILEMLSPSLSYALYLKVYNDKLINEKILDPNRNTLHSAVKL